MAQQVGTFERLENYRDKWLKPNETSGRPTLATPELAQKILKHIAAGNYLGPSCEAAGVSYKTVREWIAKAARDRDAGETSAYTEFTEQLARATGAAETALVERLNVAEDWRAQAFLLERRHRNRWGKAESQKQETQVLVISDQLAEGMLEALRVAAESRLREPQQQQQQQQTIEAEVTSSEEAEPEES